MASLRVKAGILRPEAHFQTCSQRTPKTPAASVDLPLTRGVAVPPSRCVSLGQRFSGVLDTRQQSQLGACRKCPFADPPEAS